jgi:hypothetical protein
MMDSTSALSGWQPSGPGLPEEIRCCLGIARGTQVLGLEDDAAAIAQTSGIAVVIGLGR